MKNSLKCVCGYEYERELQKTIQGKPAEIRVLKGDEPFEQIETNYGFTSGGYPPQSVQLFACPKCGTLKIIMRK